MRRLPAGHLLCADAFDELLKASRSDGKPPRCPFTRRPIPPHVAARDTWLLASTPLECLRLDALVKRVPRRERGEAARARLRVSLTLTLPLTLTLTPTLN